MFHIESYLRKTVYMTEHGSFSADKINAKLFKTRSDAQKFLLAKHLFRETCYGDDELLKHLRIVDYSAYDFHSSSCVSQEGQYCTLLTELGCVFAKQKGDDGYIRRGWWQDGVYLSESGREAWRLLNGH